MRLHCFRSLNFMHAVFQFSELMTADLQLVDGVTPNRGRLEIFLDGAWRRVCMAKSGVNFSETAVAVCRHFGYPDVLFTRSLNRSGEENKGNISFSVDCMWHGNTTSCSYERVTCEWDLFIYCQSSRNHSLEVRLANGSVPSEGYLQIGISGNWRFSCIPYHDPYYLNVINVSCKHLGYSGGRLIKQYFFFDLHSRYFLILCGFSVSTLANCVFFEEYCFSFPVIKCFNAEWQVRLVNTADTTKETEGNVEVFYKDKWTIICGGERSEWDLTGANVVCRQLGFAKASSAYSERLEISPRSLNQNHSFLTVACNGSESSLQDCEHISSQNHLCKKAVAVCKKNDCEPCSF